MTVFVTTSRKENIKRSMMRKMNSIIRSNSSTVLQQSSHTGLRGLGGGVSILGLGGGVGILGLGGACKII
jgi:Fe-S cluster biogenesis protein NfuA